MTRSDLIEILTTKSNLPAQDVEMAVKVILDEMARTLSRKERIEIRGFGSFQTKIRPARSVRNPRSGETIQKPATAIPSFKAGKELKQRINAQSN